MNSHICLGRVASQGCLPAKVGRQGGRLQGAWYLHSIIPRWRDAAARTLEPFSPRPLLLAVRQTSPMLVRFPVDVCIGRATAGGGLTDVLD